MALSHPRKPRPCFLSADKITRTKAHSVRESSLRNAPLPLGVQRARIQQMQSLMPSVSSCLEWFFLTCQGAQEQITPLTALVPSDSFSNYLDSLSHLLLSASVLSCCCCCVVLPLLLSDKPTHLCLLCCRCQLTKVTLSLSFCRWKMHWMRQTFSSSWTCTLLTVNNSKCWFKVQLVMWGSVQLENYFDEMSPF